MNVFSFYLWYNLVGDKMTQEEKMILILGLVIIVLIILSVIKFISKNKDFFSNLKLNKTYDAIVINKRHYTENNHNLFYVTFSFLDKEEEFIVKEEVYNSLNINQKGLLTLKYDCFVDFIYR